MKFCYEAEDFETKMKSFYTDRANGLVKLTSYPQRASLDNLAGVWGYGGGGAVLAPGVFSVFS